MEKVSYKELATIGTHECRKWSAKKFAKHKWVNGYLKTAYIRKARDKGYKEANRFLFEVDKKLTLVDQSHSTRPLFESQGREGLVGFINDAYLGGAFSAAMDDDELENIAIVRANRCKDIFQSKTELADTVEATFELIRFCEAQGIKAPINLTAKDTYETIAAKSVGCRERLQCSIWWRRQLRKKTARQVESVLREMGEVARKKQAPYLSNYSFSRWKAQQAKNKKLLSGMEAVNEEGETVPLDVCIEKSVANPTNRRNELMVRMRGYEEIAQGLGLMGMFLTLTCPSRFHAQRERGGVNPKYDGSNPIDAIAHLNKMWSLIRSRWQKAGIKVFGFRVAEPHHDGTPHFHLLLFINPEEKDRATQIFGDVALLVDGSEKGADTKRWDCKCIDPAKGSAAGYIAKYVAKNMDGFKVEFDDEAECLADEGAARARAWASLWGIRQFQQIGAVSVTVWRELRRKRELFEACPEQVEKLRSAADRGDWQEFVLLMGGAFVARNEQTLRPLYQEHEGRQNRYGDAVNKIIGLWLKPVAKAVGLHFVPTREHIWTVQVGRNKQANRAPPLKVDLPSVLLGSGVSVAA